MELIFETVAGTQKSTFEAAAGFTDTYFVVAERLTQLHIEVTRTTLEKTSEMVLFCIENYFSEKYLSGWLPSAA